MILQMIAHTTQGETIHLIISLKELKSIMKKILIMK